ncbi:MAG: hypothetical protein ACTSUK_05630 [Promethearchaeota archaeon]
MFKMPKQAQIDHFNAIREYVDMLYVHPDLRAVETYSNTIDKDYINVLFTPYPVKWASQFTIPLEERGYDWLVTGSVSPNYNGILAVQHHLRAKETNKNLKYLTTMQSRYDGWIHFFDGHILEMHWHSWLKQIAHAKRYLKTTFTLAARSTEIACACLGIETFHVNPYHPPLPNLELFSFESNRIRIKEELESILNG